VDRLSPDDARILGLETAAIKGHTCKVIVVEPGPQGALGVDAVRDRIATRVGLVPRFRQRVAPTPLGIAPPAWVDDPDFDLDLHVRRVPTRSVVGADRLRAIVNELMSERLDHARPLWRVDVVTPLSGRRTAIVVRIHHCMADGVSALRMLAALLWDGSGKAGTPRPTADPPGRGALLAAAVGDRAAAAARRVPGLARAAASPARWRDSASRLAREPGAMLRELRPLAATSPLDRDISGTRDVAFARRPLAELKAIEAAVGDHVTVNDVLLAAVAGGLRDWLAERHERPEAMRVQVPVSMHSRAERADELGNRDSFLFVDLPVDEPDPLGRLRAINAETVERKQRRDADELYSFFHHTAHLGPITRAISRFTSGAREFTLSVSNVPGPRERVSLAGHGVCELYSIAEPADRHALRVSAVSLAGTMHVAVCSDPEAVAGTGAVAAGIDRAIGELLVRAREA
jgi:diacylglycerol O-acyltransferase / wax synthase